MIDYTIYKEIPQFNISEENGFEKFELFSNSADKSLNILHKFVEFFKEYTNKFKTFALNIDNLFVKTGDILPDEFKYTEYLAFFYRACAEKFNIIKNMINEMDKIQIFFNSLYDSLSKKRPKIQYRNADQELAGLLRDESDLLPAKEDYFTSMDDCLGQLLKLKTIETSKNDPLIKKEKLIFDKKVLVAKEKKKQYKKIVDIVEAKRKNILTEIVNCWEGVENLTRKNQISNAFISFLKGEDTIINNLKQSNSHIYAFFDNKRKEDSDPKNSNFFRSAEKKDKEANNNNNENNNIKNRINMDLRSSQGIQQIMGIIVKRFGGGINRNRIDALDLMRPTEHIEDIILPPEKLSDIIVPVQTLTCQEEYEYDLDDWLKVNCPLYKSEYQDYLIDKYLDFKQNFSFDFELFRLSVDDFMYVKMKYYGMKLKKYKFDYFDYMIIVDFFDDHFDKFKFSNEIIDPKNHHNLRYLPIYLLLKHLLDKSIKFNSDLFQDEYISDDNDFNNFNKQFELYKPKIEIENNNNKIKNLDDDDSNCSLELNEKDYPSFGDISNTKYTNLGYLIKLFAHVFAYDLDEQYIDYELSLHLMLFILEFSLSDKLINCDNQIFLLDNIKQHEIFRDKLFWIGMLEHLICTENSIQSLRNFNEYTFNFNKRFYPEFLKDINKVTLKIESKNIEILVNVLFIILYFSINSESLNDILLAIFDYFVLDKVNRRLFVMILKKQILHEKTISSTNLFQNIKFKYRKNTGNGKEQKEDINDNNIENSINTNNEKMEEKKMSELEIIKNIIRNRHIKRVGQEEEEITLDDIEDQLLKEEFGSIIMSIEEQEKKKEKQREESEKELVDFLEKNEEMIKYADMVNSGEAAKLRRNKENNTIEKPKDKKNTKDLTPEETELMNLENYFNQNYYELSLDPYNNKLKEEYEANKKNLRTKLKNNEEEEKKEELFKVIDKFDHAFYSNFMYKFKRYDILEIISHMNINEKMLITEDSAFNTPNFNDKKKVKSSSTKIKVNDNVYSLLENKKKNLFKLEKKELSYKSYFLITPSTSEQNSAISEILELNDDHLIAVLENFRICIFSSSDKFAFPKLSTSLNQKIFKIKKSNLVQNSAYVCLEGSIMLLDFIDYSAKAFKIDVACLDPDNRFMDVWEYKPPASTNDGNENSQNHQDNHFMITLGSNGKLEAFQNFEKTVLIDKDKNYNLVEACYLGKDLIICKFINSSSSITELRLFSINFIDSLLSVQMRSSYNADEPRFLGQLSTNFFLMCYMRLDDNKKYPYLRVLKDGYPLFNIEIDPETNFDVFHKLQNNIFVIGNKKNNLRAYYLEEENGAYNLEKGGELNIGKISEGAKVRKAFMIGKYMLCWLSNGKFLLLEMY